MSTRKKEIMVHKNEKSNDINFPGIINLNRRSRSASVANQAGLLLPVAGLGVEGLKRSWKCNSSSSSNSNNRDTKPGKSLEWREGE